MKYIKYGLIGLLVLFLGGCAKNASLPFAYFGEYEKMQDYLNRGGDVDQCITGTGSYLPRSECTPLLYAASENHFRIVKLLVEHGADVQTNARDNTHHLLLLNHAIASRNIPMVKYLMDRGAQTDNYNDFPTADVKGTLCGYDERVCKARKFAIGYADELKMKRIKTEQGKINDQKNIEIDNLLGI